MQDRFKRAAAGAAVGVALVLVSLPFALRTRTKFVPLDPALFAPEKVHVTVFAHEATSSPVRE